MKHLMLLPLLVAAALFVQGCKEGSGEEAGKKLDNAAEKTKEAAKDAADKTGDALKKAGDKAKEAAK